LEKDVAGKGDNASHFGQKQEKHIILKSINQPNDTQSEKAYHFMSWEPRK